MNSERDTCTLYSVLMVWLESYGNYEKKPNRHGHVPKGTEYPPNILGDCSGPVPLLFGF